MGKRFESEGRGTVPGLFQDGLGMEVGPGAFGRSGGAFNMEQKEAEVGIGEGGVGK